MNYPRVAYAKTVKTPVSSVLSLPRLGVFEKFTLGGTPSRTYQIIGIIIMPNTVNLSTHFAQQVTAAASAGSNTIVSGNMRTARQLCGPAFWGALTKPEQIHAGKIISAAVNAGMLPVVGKGSSSSNHQRYQLG